VKNNILMYCAMRGCIVKKSKVLGFVFLLLFSVISGKAQPPQSISYSFMAGPSVNWFQSNDLLFQLNKFQTGWDVDLNIHFPIDHHYFTTAGVGVNFVKASLVYKDDEIETEYFSKDLDARNLVWQADAYYYKFPITINLQTDPINESIYGILGVGLVNRVRFMSNFNILNDGVSEFSDFSWVRRYHLSAQMHISFKWQVSRNNLFLFQLSYENGITPFQSFDIPDVRHKSLALKLGLTFNMDNL
jgi:hypothetical protein